jgi:hypothetical protein
MLDAGLLDELHLLVHPIAYGVMEDHRALW